MEKKEKLIESIIMNVEQDTVSKVNNVNTRECSSENYDGVSITITGSRVPIRPILEAVESFEDWRVENIGMYNDIPEDDDYVYGITAFCAYCPQDFKNDILT